MSFASIAKSEAEKTQSKQRNMCTTWNGAPSHASTTSGRVDFFYGALRGVSTSKLIELASASWDEDALHTLKIIAYVRDCRGGKGERQLGRDLISWLANNHVNHLVQNLEHYIGIYGRYDDVVALIATAAEKEAFQLLSKQLHQDLANLQEGEMISLCAKWIPSENKSADRKYSFHKKLCKFMKVRPFELRKKYLAPLRKALNLVESFMCANEWDKIDFNQVPSIAMHRYGKKDHAFQRHLKKKFLKWKEGLSSGKNKVNARVLFPHQIVERYGIHGYCAEKIDMADDLLEAQWKVMIEKGKELGNLSKCVVMSDVSGSMTGTPMLISLTIGAFVSELAEGDYKNLIMTFESVPRFHHIVGDTLYERLQCLRNSPWGGSTNFVSALQEIIDLGLRNKIPSDQMPEKLIVVSDMQFDDANNRGSFDTNYRILRQKYTKAGYTIPHLVFWNVNGKVSDFPTLSSQAKVSLISGFSVEILKAVLAGDDEITPLQTVMNAIIDERYDLITLAANTLENPLNDESLVIL